MISRAADESPVAIQSMMKEVQSRIEEVFDVKNMVCVFVIWIRSLSLYLIFALHPPQVLKALVNDKELLNEIFLRCGATEFRFIKISGAWIGFFFGLIQMGIWLFYKAWWYVDGSIL